MNSLSGAFYPTFAAPSTESGINRGVDAFSRVWPLPFEQYIIQRFDDLVSRMDFLNSIVLSRGGVTAVVPFPPSVPEPDATNDVTEPVLSDIPFNPTERRFAIPILPPNSSLLPVSNTFPVESSPLPADFVVSSPLPVVSPLPAQPLPTPPRRDPPPPPILSPTTAALPDVVSSVVSGSRKKLSFKERPCPNHALCTNKKCPFQHPKESKCCNDAAKCDGSCGRKFHKCFHKPQCLVKMCKLLHEPGQRTALNQTHHKKKPSAKTPLTPTPPSSPLPSAPSPDVVSSLPVPLEEPSVELPVPIAEPLVPAPLSDRPFEKHCKTRPSGFAVKVVEGAPGSGKTNHLCELIVSLKGTKRVHVATASYRACFELGSRLAILGLVPFVAPLEVRKPTDLARQRRKQFFPSYVSGRSPAECTVFLFVTSMLRSNMIKATNTGADSKVNPKAVLSKEEEKSFWEIAGTNKIDIKEGWNRITTVSPSLNLLIQKGYISVAPDGTPKVLNFPSQTTGTYSLSRNVHLRPDQLRHQSMGTNFPLPDLLVVDEASTIPAYHLNSLQYGVPEVYLIGDRNQRRPIADLKESRLLTDFDEKESYFTTVHPFNLSFLHSADRCPRDVYELLRPFYCYLDVASINTTPKTSDMPGRSPLVLLPRLESVKAAEKQTGKLCCTVDESQGTTAGFVEVHTLSQKDFDFLRHNVESSLVAMTRHTTGFIWYDNGNKRSLRDFFHTFLQAKEPTIRTSSVTLGYHGHCRDELRRYQAFLATKLACADRKAEEQKRQATILSTTLERERVANTQAEQKLRARHQLETLAMEEASREIIHQKSVELRANMEMMVSQTKAVIEKAQAATTRPRLDEGRKNPPDVLKLVSKPLPILKPSGLTKKEEKQRKREVEYLKTQTLLNQEVRSKPPTPSTKLQPAPPPQFPSNHCQWPGCAYTGVCLDWMNFCVEHKQQ